MPADVVERAQLAVIASRYNNGFSGVVCGEETSFVTHLIGAPHNLPCFREHAALFEFVDARIEVPRRGNRPRLLQRIIRIVQIKKVANVALHETPLAQQSSPCLIRGPVPISYPDTPLN